MKLFGKTCSLAALALAAAAIACGDDGKDIFRVDAGDDAGGSDTETGSESETESESESETDEPDAGDTDPGLAGPGEPCWKESFGDFHPNAGLPDCETGYVCVGDSSYAYCSETCDATGDVDASGGPFDGWCCGEFSNPCDPWRFWVPSALSGLCLPRTAGLTDPCVESGTWPSSDVRCAPRCEGTTLLSETICEMGGDTPFCTFPCTDTDDVLCEVEDEFIDGCCQLFGATYECAPAEMCGV